MAHEWNAGAGAETFWHGLNVVRPMGDAAAMIAAGYETLGWAERVDLLPVTTADGLQVPGRAVVGTYHDGSRKAFDVVSDQYRPLEPAQWEDLVRAACEAGALPQGAFSLRGGAVQVASFALPNDRGERIRSFLNLLNTYDRSGHGEALTSSVCVVCANTMRAARSEASGGIARIRHTGDMTAKVKDLCVAVDASMADARSMRELYAEAREARLSREQAAMVVGAIYPVPAPVDADGAPLDPSDVAAGKVRAANQAAITRAANKRADLGDATRLEVNNDGPTLATLWNGATYLVDRTPDGRARPSTTPALDSMLLGSRGQQVERIRRVVVRVLRADGSESDVDVSSAEGTAALGTLGRSLLADML